MQYRHLFPMVRLLLPFMAGIILSVAVSAVVPVPAILVAAILLLAIISGFLPFVTRKYGLKWLFGFFISLFLFVFGFNLVILHKEILRPSHFSFIQQPGSLIVSVDNPWQEKEHSFKTILSVKGIKNGKKIMVAEGHLLAYFEKDSMTKLPEAGSIIAVSANPQEISPPQNPGAFNYKKYMAASNVYHQVYVKNNSWLVLEGPQGFDLYLSAQMITKYLVTILHENGLEGKEFAVASALMLGQNDMLDAETLREYSGSGVMHILSVSGLHVGVIFLIINFLLGFMNKSRWQIWLKTIIILLTIWSYALLTGLSAPVMRASVMFTFVTVGNASNRYVHIINSLAVSAFLLLLINPLVISNVGFQLSYLGIIGIVFINKPIADLWKPSNRIVSYIWELIAVSIAAQIATGPLAILYFHQFPLYFLPANLVAIPLSGFVIYSGLLVMVTSFVPVVSQFFGIITSFLLKAMNSSVGFFEQLPFSVMGISSVFTNEMLLIYLMITSILLLVYYKRKIFLHISLLFILMLTISISFTGIGRGKQLKMIVYSANKQSAIGFVNGNEQVLVADSLLLNDRKTVNFQLGGAKSLFGISTTHNTALDTILKKNQVLATRFDNLAGFGDYFLFANRRIGLIYKLPQLKDSMERLNLDYLIVRENPKIKMTDVNQFYKSQLVVFDGSNSFYKTEKWLADCRNIGIKAYSLKKSGAFLADLNNSLK